MIVGLLILEQEQRDADFNAVKEQIKHLNCIFYPCLYGGRCELNDIDASFVTKEFGVDLGVFEAESKERDVALKDVPEVR